MLRQRTLRGPVQAIGIGLHSGQRVSLNIKPGPIDSGIVFRRVDLDPVVELPALAHRITDTRLNTTLSADVEGDNITMIHSSSSKGVVIEPYNTPYFAKRYVGAGRVSDLAQMITDEMSK